MRHASDIPAGTAGKPEALQKLRWVTSYLLTDRSAVTAIEFAMVAPALVLLIVESLQIGLYFYTSASLEAATIAGARQILTGAVASQGLTATQFRTQILCPSLPGTMSCANVITNIQTVPEATSPAGFYSFVNASQTAIIQPAMDNTKTSFCAGTTGSYMYIQVYICDAGIEPDLECGGFGDLGWKHGAFCQRRRRLQKRAVPIVHANRLLRRC